MSSLDDAIGGVPVDPLDAAIDTVDQGGARLRSSLYGAVKQNPDEAARALQLSRKTGLPAPLVQRNLPQIEQRATLDDLDAVIDKNSAVGRKMTEAEFAALAHDDVGTLSGIEDLLKPPPAPPLASGFGQASQELRREQDARSARLDAFFRPRSTISASRGPEASLASVVAGQADVLPNTLDRIREGLRLEFADTFGLDEMAAGAIRRRDRVDFREALTTPEFDSTAARWIYGGAANIQRVAPSIAAGILTRNPYVGLAGMGAQVQPETYGKYRARGATPGEAAAGSGIETGIEIGTEMLPMGFLVDKFGKAGAKDFIAGYLGRELPTELVAEISQGAVDTAIANPDKTWGQFAAELPETIGQTVVATLMMSGGLTAAHEAARRLAPEQEQATAATQDADVRAQLAQFAAASKLRTRDPQTFQEFVAAATEGTPAQDVYLDARTLQQSGVDVAALAQASPAVAAQLQQALATGGDLVIPMAEYATAIAGTDLDPVLTPHLRTSEESLSLDEAQRFYQGQADQFQAAAAKVMEEKTADETFKASAKVVEDKLFGELRQAGRFTDDVNSAYATIMRDFYVATSGRLGITPTEMFARYPLRVAAESVAGGQRMDQEERSRAEAAGFNTSTEWLHGTTAKNFRAFKPGKGGVNELGPGVYFTKQEMYAKTWARGEKGRVIRTYLKRGDLFDYAQPIDYLALARRLKAHNAALSTDASMTAPNEALWRTWLNESDEGLAAHLKSFAPKGDLNAWLDRAGYIGAVDANSQIPEQVVVFDPKNIRSVDAKFDSAKADSANIMAQPGVANAKDSAYTADNILEQEAKDGQPRTDRPGLPAEQEPRTIGGGAPRVGWAESTRVRLKDGRPAVVYRGAGRGLGPADFGRDALGVATGNPSSGLGVWFTPHRDEAGRFGDVEPFQLDLRAPKVIKIEDLPGFDSVDAAHAFREDLRSQGYDGIAVDARHVGGPIHFVAFDAETVIRPPAAQPLDMGQFFQSDKADLVIQHNLTAENLLHAAKMGGIPVPSLAITKKDHPLEGFGEITLLGSKDLADPKGYAGTKVFGADIYSPRYPSVEYQFTPAMQKRVEAQLKDGIEATGGYIDWSEVASRGPEELARSAPFMWDFLKNKGIEPQVVYTQPTPLPDVFKPFAEDGVDAFDLQRDPAFIDAVYAHWTDELTQAYDGDRAAAEAEVAQTRKNAEDRGTAYLVRDWARRVNQYRMDSASAGKVDSYATRRMLEDQARTEGLRDEMNTAAQDLFAEVGPNERIFQGFTNSGNRRYVAHTLENVVEILKKELRGGENFNYGVGSIRAKFTPQFKSIKQIREAKDRLMDKAAFEKVKDEIDAEFFALREQLAPYHSVGGEFRFSDTMTSMMYDAAKMGVPRALRENGFGEVPTEDQQDIAEFLGRLRELPTEYFEAKILRDVDLTEFSGAVVPEGVDPKVIEALHSRGVKDIRTYKKGDEADRAAKIGEFENLFFQSSNQGNRAEISFAKDITSQPSVIALFKNADLSSFLHEMGHFQLEVLANIASRPDAPVEIVGDLDKVFKWFGITGTEQTVGGETAGALGQGGKTKRLYHGSNSKIEGPFRTLNKSINSTTFGDVETERHGIFFSDNAEYAAEHGEVGQYDVALKNTAKISRDLILDFAETIDPFGADRELYLLAKNSRQSWGLFEGKLGKRFTEYLKGKGYDSATFSEELERADGSFVEGRTYVALNAAAVSKVDTLNQGDDTTPKPTSLPPGRTPLEVWQAMSLEEKRPYHEAFARGFEAYLFEGKAPNTELNGVFARFRAWLVNVYKSVKALNVEISDDIRGVFDRLVATDEAIKQAEAARSMLPLFKSAEEMGGDAEAWAAYQRTGAQATEDAVSDLQRRGLRDMQWLTNARGRILKQLQADAKAKRQAVEEEVRAEIEARPEWQAQAYLKRENATDPAQLEARKAWEVSRDAAQTATAAEVKAEYLAAPEAADLKGLQKGQYIAKNKRAMANETDRRMLAWEQENPRPKRDPGDLDLIGEMFGFTSGDHMMKSIRAAGPKAEIIEGMTDQRVLERYGDLASPDTLARAVDEAIHNEARARFVATELKAVSQAAGPVRAITAAAKAFAETMVARKKVKDIKPRQHAAAETRAAKAAEKAMAEGDTLAAATEKRNQLVQNYSTRTAYDALDEIDKAVKYLRKFDSEGTRKNLDTEYVDQIDQLLERFDLRASVGNKDTAKREKLAAWLESQREQGFEPDIPADLVDSAMRKPYRELTLEELRGLVDTVKQIEHLGRLKQKLLTAKDEREFAAVVDAIRASITANAKGTRDLRTRNTTGAMLKDAGNRFLAMHRKMASVSREMDGYADGGPMWEYFIRSMNAAGDRETTHRAAATAKLYELVKPLLKSGRMGGKGQYFETLGASFNREERIAIALNLGNAGNMQRLLGGEGWTPERLKPLLDTITPEEADFVQAVWDFFESYRPEIAAKERRIYGKEPAWVEPQPVMLGGKTLKGGYYPIKYDTARSGRAEQHADAEAAKAQMRGAYTSATTRRSFTKARAEEVTGRPLVYSFAGLYQGTNEVIHDLTWHEWLIDANRLLRAIDGPMRLHYGAETVGLFKAAIQDIAAGDVPAQNVFERGLNHVRTGATIAGLGWNLMTSLLQPVGLTQSMARIGPGWVAKGMGQWIKAPLATIEDIQSKSAMMTDRARTMQREINEIQNQVRGSQLDPVRSTFFVLIQKMQMLADVPTWLGAYEKHIAAGEVEERAAALADQAVLDAQGGGQMKDLSQIQRGHPALKLFTNFYSFFNVLHNLGVEKTKQKIGQPKLYPSLALDYLLLYSLPAVIVTVMKEAILGGGDDEDELVDKIIADQISYLLGTMVGLREVTAAAQKVAGVEQFKGSYGGPAGLRLFQEIDKLGQQVGQGEADMALFKSANNVAGIVFHYPSGQVNRSAEGVAAMIEGKTENPMSLVVGPPKD